MTNRTNFRVCRYLYLHFICIGARVDSTIHMEVLVVICFVRYVLLSMLFVHCIMILPRSRGRPFCTILLREQSSSGQYDFHGGFARYLFCQNKRRSSPKRYRCHSIIQTNTTQKHNGHTHMVFQRQVNSLRTADFLPLAGDEFAFSSRTSQKRKKQFIYPDQTTSKICQTCFKKLTISILL